MALVALALVDRQIPAWRARRGMPTGEAQWIWVQRDHRSATPEVFYAARDFDLAAPPARARLLIAADEEYVLTLNGKRIGAGVYAPARATRLDAYEVGPVLLPGGNRLVAELRSTRGAGGFLVSLEEGGSGRQLLATDETWRVFRGYDLGLARGWSPLGGGAPASSWGYPPIGLWGRPEAGAERPLLTALAGKPIPARGGPAAGPRALFDFGREVTGYLVLELSGVSAGEKVDAGLLYTGAEPPAPVPGSSGASVLLAPRQPRWLDARPRRFRYALVLGLERPAEARVLPVDPQTVPAEAPAGGERRGVFGIADPPPLRTPVENEVWRELQRLPGVAGREEL